MDGRKFWKNIENQKFHEFIVWDHLKFLDPDPVLWLKYMLISALNHVVLALSIFFNLNYKNKQLQIIKMTIVWILEAKKR